VEHRARVFIERARLGPDAPSDGYPFTLPAVRHLAKIPFDQVTILVGDNGTGKSTIVPGATIVELDEDGANVRQYDDVLAVQLWRRFLDDPPSLLRHLLDDDVDLQG
jgi:predicted ATPase